MNTLKRWLALAGLAALVALTLNATPASARKSKKDKDTKEAAATDARSTSTTSSPVDLNTASQKDLEALPGIGASKAMKIIAGRPYGSVTDLARAGISKGTIEKITSMVFASGGGTPASTGGVAETPARKPRKTRGTAAPSTAASSGASSASPAQAVDLNTASQKDLEALPGIGASKATKIIAGRPYGSVADLARAGITKGTIEKIAPMVRVSGRAAASAQAPAQAQAGSSRSTAARPATTTPARPAAAGNTMSSEAAGAAGMVWVNLDSKVYHYKGDHWYGNTKSGKYMSERDAMAAGYRASRQKVSDK